MSLSRKLDIDANLRCSLDGDSLLITAEGRRITFRAETLGTAFKLARLGPAGGILRRLRFLQAFVTQTQMSLEYHVRGKTLFSMSSDIESYSLSWLGLRNTKVGALPNKS